MYTPLPEMIKGEIRYYSEKYFRGWFRYWKLDNGELSFLKTPIGLFLIKN